MKSIDIKTAPEGLDVARLQKKPARHQTWREIIRHVTSLSPAELEAEFGAIAAELKSGYGDTFKTLRELMVLRAIQDFLANPSPSMFNLLMERDEGKVADGSKEVNVNIHQDWKELAKELGVDEADAIREAEKILKESYKDE